MRIQVLKSFIYNFLLSVSINSTIDDLIISLGLIYFANNFNYLLGKFLHKPY